MFRCLVCRCLSTSPPLLLLLLVVVVVDVLQGTVGCTPFKECVFCVFVCVFVSCNPPFAGGRQNDIKSV